MEMEAFAHLLCYNLDDTVDDRGALTSRRVDVDTERHTMFDDDVDDDVVERRVDPLVVCRDGRGLCFGRFFTC